MTAHIRSTLVMRFAESSSASSIGRPRRDSVNTRWSSRHAWVRWPRSPPTRGPGRTRSPARIDPESRFSVLGSWTWNSRRRFLRRRCSHATGRMAAATMRIRARPGGKSMMPSSAMTKTLREVEEQGFGWAERQVGPLERVFGARQEAGTVGEPAGEADHPLQDRGLGEDLVGPCVRVELVDRRLRGPGPARRGALRCCRAGWARDMKISASANARIAAASNTANTIFDGAARLRGVRGRSPQPPASVICGEAANSDGSSEMP